MDGTFASWVANGSVAETIYPRTFGQPSTHPTDSGRTAIPMASQLRSYRATRVDKNAMLKHAIGKARLRPAR